VALTDEGIIEVPGLASRWVRLASGAKAHYVTSGDSGPAVLLLHGGLPGSSVASFGLDACQRCSIACRLDARRCC